MKRLAVLDWGIGGAGFWKGWKARFPKAPLIYYSDAGYTPYGKVDASELVERLASRMEALHDMGASHAMIACNAASTVIPELRKEVTGVQIEGVIDPTLRWMKSEFDLSKSLAVVGGQRTIDSGLYKISNQVRTIIGQPLSALVEKGTLEGDEVEETIHALLGDVVGDLILACTHYVALSPVIERVVPAVKCHDPIPFLIEERAHHWGDFSTEGEDQFATSGDLLQMKATASRAFGVSW